MEGLIGRQRTSERFRQVAVDRTFGALRGHTRHLQRAVTMAHMSFDVPYAQLNLVDRGRLRSLAHIGRSSDGLMRSLSGLVVLTDEPLLVGDASADSRFALIPETRGRDAIRFYAGHPIKSQDGYRVGVLCVLDTEPHEILDSDRHLLSDIALLVEGELIALTSPPPHR